VRPRAADLLNLEYSEVEPDSMPIQVFEQKARDFLHFPR
jgi:hypothetical protein